MSIVHTKHSDIAKYWLGKYILPNGSISENKGELIITDPYEPSCWGCDKPIFTNNKNIEDFEKVWNSTNGKLERCHIFPESLGGKDQPDNLFLLCPHCHKESPDTANREAFFRWVYDKREKFTMGIHKPQTIMKDIDIELERRGIDETFISLLEKLPENKLLLLNEKFNKYEIFGNRVKNNSEGYSYLKTRVSGHFGEPIDHHSVIIGCVDTLLNFYTEVSLK